MTADWLDEVEALKDAEAEEDPDEGAGGGWSFTRPRDPAIDEELARLQPLITVAAGRIAQTSAFLTARSNYERRNVIEADSELAEWHNNYADTPAAKAQRVAVSEVLEIATRLAEPMKTERFQAALSNVDGLAQGLVADKGFSSALADSKRRQIRTLISTTLGFPSADLTDRVYTRATQLLKASRDGG